MPHRVAPEITRDGASAHLFPNWTGATYALAMCARDGGDVGETLGRAFEVCMTATPGGVALRFEWPRGQHWFLTAHGLRQVEGRSR